MAGWIKMPLGTEVDLGPGVIVLDGNPTRPQRGGTAPPILAHVLWPNGCMDQGATWCWGSHRPQATLCYMRTQLLLKRGTPPPVFGPCLLCQRAGWMKIPFGMEVGLSPGDIVLNGDSAPLERGTAPPTFRPMSIVAKWLDGSRCH